MSAFNSNRVNGIPGKRNIAVSINSGKVELQGNLVIPDNPEGLVIFAHGSGSSRNSPRNRYVSNILTSYGFATLLFDLLTETEEANDYYTGKIRFDINMLADRLADATVWINDNKELVHLKTGYFGASTGAAAAIVATVKTGNRISAIVSRGGRPDLASEYLSNLNIPVLLLAGGNDPAVIDLNEIAMKRINSIKELIIIPGAGHLFEEPGALEKVADNAGIWFSKYLKKE